MVLAIRHPPARSRNLNKRRCQPAARAIAQAMHIHRPPLANRASTDPPAPRAARNRFPPSFKFQPLACRHDRDPVAANVAIT
jgi:hypothetical protein